MKDVPYVITNIFFFLGALIFTFDLLTVGCNGCIINALYGMTLITFPCGVPKP